MWAVALMVMVLGAAAAMFDGWPLLQSMLLGLIIGPGWLAVASVFGLLCWVFGRGYKEYPW